MSPMASLDAQHALRLANERLDGYRAEARAARTVSAKSSERFRSLRQLLAGIRAAVPEVEPDRPMVRLVDYPYRG